MNTGKNIVSMYVTIVVLLTAGSLCAQNYKQLDSILKTATNEIYNNPDNVIKLGEIVVKQSGDNVDYKIKGYKLISDAYSSKRYYEKSLDYLIKASELLNNSNDKLLKINIINKTGIQYHQLKVYDKAMQHLYQAEQLIAEYPVKDSIYIELGKNYLIRGFIYKEKLSYDIAIDFMDRGIAELNKSKDTKEALARISIAVYNKGNYYLLLNNNKLAMENFQQSAEIARKVNAKSLEAFALKGLAKIHTLEGNNSEAIEALNEAIYLSSDVNDLILNQEVYKGLAENYLAVNQWDQFEIYQLKFIETQKLIKDIERISVSDSLEVKEAEQKLKKKELLNKFYYILLVLIFILILVVLFFYVIIKRKKNEIEIIKSQISTLQNEKVKEA